MNQSMLLIRLQLQPARHMVPQRHLKPQEVHCTQRLRRLRT
jgi:hypothetical protein